MEDGGWRNENRRPSRCSTPRVTPAGEGLSARPTRVPVSHAAGSSQPQLDSVPPLLLNAP